MSTDNVIGFFAPEKENGYLSNSFPSYFEYAGLSYSSAEQFIAAQKAILFGDYEMYNEILLEHDAEEIRSLSGEIMNCDEAVWKKLRPRMLRRGVRAKFQQNPELLEWLLSTGNTLLVECSPDDTELGIGLDINDTGIQEPHKWRGENQLGTALMQARADLRCWIEISGGDIGYIDAIDAEANDIWAMPIAQVKHLPEYRDALDIYFDITLFRLHGDRFFYDGCGLTLAELEELMAGETGGGLPAAWFFELKQEIYDTVRFCG